MNIQHRIFVIILNYHSSSDTINCIKRIRNQCGIDYTVVVVDNSLGHESLNEIVRHYQSNKSIFPVVYNRKKAEAGGDPLIESRIEEKEPRDRIVFIKNDQNLGYSAGNNVGVRYALSRGATAVLILNPDVVLLDPATIRSLNETLLGQDRFYVVAPRVLDGEGRDQNPMREPSFGEELLGTIYTGISARWGSRKRGFLDEADGVEVRVVDKVVGCCLMIKAVFLRDYGLLDEGIFMYSEEPILSHKVQQSGGVIAYLPSITVRHLHREKKTGVYQYRQFIKSRTYFLSKYKGYNSLQIALLKISYSTVLFIKMLELLNNRLFRTK